MISIKSRVMNSTENDIVREQEWPYKKPTINDCSG